MHQTAATVYSEIQSGKRDTKITDSGTEGVEAEHLVQTVEYKKDLVTGFSS